MPTCIWTIVALFQSHILLLLYYVCNVSAIKIAVFFFHYCLLFITALSKTAIWLHQWLWIIKQELRSNHRMKPGFGIFTETLAYWNQVLQCCVARERGRACPVMRHTEMRCPILSTYDTALVIINLKSAVNTYEVIAEARIRWQFVFMASQTLKLNIKNLFKN